MKIRKDGIYITIDSKDFGFYQKSGWEKVVTDEPKIIEKPKEEIIIEEPKEEKIIEEKPVEEEIIPKSKKKKK